MRVLWGWGSVTRGFPTLQCVNKREHRASGDAAVTAAGSPSRLRDVGAGPIGPCGPPEVAVCLQCGGTP